MKKLVILGHGTGGTVRGRVKSGCGQSCYADQLAEG